MSTDTIEYDIENVGGIERAHLVLRPGLNVLRGVNGAGKTSALRAISRAQGAEIEIEKRDGSDHGEVRGGGVLLRVGKVARVSGEAELGLADVAPLSRLIDPGIQDSDSAARARLRALVELLGLAVDDDAIATLAGGEPTVAEWLTREVAETPISDLMVAAEKARGRFHALAREHEDAAERAKARHDIAAAKAQMVRDSFGGALPEVALTVELARAQVSEGGREYERAVARCEARERLEARQAEIRATLGERPDPAPHHAKAEGLAAEIAALDDNAAEIQREIEKLQHALAEARAARSGKAAERSAALDAAAEAQAAAKRWDEGQAVLAQAVEGPTRGELADIGRRHVAAAIAALDQAERYADHEVALGEVAEATESHGIAMREAMRLRALAGSIPGRLGEILAKAGAPGLTVVGGRIQALAEDGTTLDFERRLSTGQRVRLALDVAAHVFGSGQVVPLDGDWWASLDPENRAEFAALARERGLVVLTEEPADGDLRVEHVGGDAEIEAPL